MNKERAREVLTKEGKMTEEKIEYYRQRGEDIPTAKELVKALYIAIECIDNEQNIEQIKEKLLEKFKEHCYPVTQKDNSIENGMTLTGITQVLNEVFSNIDSLDNEWVDVRDRLPSESGYYVVTREYNNLGVIENEVRQFYFNGEKWLTDFEGVDITLEVIAWKKVEPYERKESK